MPMLPRAVRTRKISKVKKDAVTASATPYNLDQMRVDLLCGNPAVPDEQIADWRDVIWEARHKGPFLNL
jgi:hypothetical protein